MNQFQELIYKGTNLLSKCGIKKARYETMILAKKSLNKSMLELLINSEIDITKNQKKKILQRICKRINGKPISKICGRKEFFSNEFIVNCDVLDPRPESELIVEVIKKINKKFLNKKLRILDLGTGSGCLLISIFLELKSTKIFGLGIDISEKALKIASKNLKKFNLHKKLFLKKSNWFSNVKGKFDIIVSNPPYIESSNIIKLSREVRNFDPLIALDGGSDGLEGFKKIALVAKEHLRGGGMVCLELGKGQINRVDKIFGKAGFNAILKEKDLQGISRVVVYKIK